MKQEDKELLLKDLCARLPYGVIVDYKENEFEFPHWRITTIYPETMDGWIGYYKRIGAGSESGSRPFNIGDVKLYLRPMSSMTEEEKEELKQISNDYLDEWENTKTSLERWKLDAKESYKRAVFYNSHHFDWNGLIEKNLALDCTGLHIYD